MTSLWGGRFTDGPADALVAFTESVSFDHVLVDHDCRVLAAHAATLGRAGILTQSEVDAVREALPSIASDIAEGRFPALPADEDIHTTVERALLERVPDAGAKARAGLSRNDRVAAALRLWLLDEGRAISMALADLIEVLTDRAATDGDVPMPGYTHLQRAQPVTLAHHLLAHATALVRDADRAIDALRRTDASPLGSGALAGSTLGLDAVHAARAAGFTRVMPNSLDAVSARDFVAEFLSFAAILGIHVSRIGEEVVIWTSAEFGFATLDDANATGSSLMPQKKNPDIAELARGKAGRLIGDLTGLLSTLKGLPLAYNRDLQEDKEPLFDAVTTLNLMLPAVTGMLRTVTFHAERLSGALDGSALATDLAEALVRNGVPFRTAHEQVGEVVSRAVAAGRDLAEVAAEVWPEIPLDVAASIAARSAPGPAGVPGQIAAVREAIARIRTAAGGAAAQ